MISCAWRSASFTISVCDASRTACSRASPSIRSHLALRLGEHLLALLDDPARLLDLLGDRRAHLVEDVVDLLAVDAHLVGERHGLRVVHEVVELVDEYENVHGVAVYSRGVLGRAGSPVREELRKRRATGGGTSSSTFPPKAAISFTPLEETKLTLRARHHVDRLDLGRERAGSAGSSGTPTRSPR